MISMISSYFIQTEWIIQQNAVRENKIVGINLTTKYETTIYKNEK